MALPISILICGAVSVATLYLMVQHFIRCRRQEGLSLEELDRRSERLVRELKRLSGLQGEQRLAACRTIAEEMRWHSGFLLSIVNDWRYDNREKEDETTEPAIAVYREARELHRMVTRILFLMRFRPSLLKDCHRLREAARQFGRMWEAFSRFCQAQIPNELEGLEPPI